MDTFEHELLVVVQVCESKDGRRSAHVFEVYDGDCESEAMIDAGKCFGEVEVELGRPEWVTRGYVQRLTLRLPIEAETIPTIVVEPARKSTTKRLPSRRR